MNEESIKATVCELPVALLDAIEKSIPKGADSAAGVSVSSTGRSLRWYFMKHPQHDDHAAIWIEFDDLQPQQSLRFERTCGQPWHYVGTWLGPSRINELIEYDQESQRHHNARN